MVFTETLMVCGVAPPPLTLSHGVADDGDAVIGIAVAVLETCTVCAAGAVPLKVRERGEAVSRVPPLTRRSTGISSGLFPAPEAVTRTVPW